MAQKQIAARLGGDDYQARFFWYHAASLLLPNTSVHRVKLEDSEVAYLDDVTVHHFPPGRLDRGVNALVDYYQVKFHVDHTDAYCADGLLDASFIGSKTKSLLERFHHAYSNLKSSGDSFTLGLVSNWSWRDDDEIAKSIRHSGTLPDDFCQRGPRSSLGKVRTVWQEHLKIDDQEFFDFTSCLRLKLNYFGLYDWNSVLNDRLQLAGLLPIDPSRSGSLYDDLARKFICEGETTFDAECLHGVCEREGLIAETPKPPPPRLGFRTFIRFAENMESETEEFVCGADLFDGRHPCSDSAWKDLYHRFQEFVLVQTPKVALQHHVLLDCHVSAALISGYLFTERAAVVPLGPRPGLIPQLPGTGVQPSNQDGVWDHSTTDLGTGSDVAIAVSVTHKIGHEVRKFLSKSDGEFSTLFELTPVGGVGKKSVKDANHAVELADDLVETIRNLASDANVKHLFIAAPNFLTFFIGQRLRALGEVKTYEFDFDGPEPREYYCALTLPHRGRLTTEV